MFTNSKNNFGYSALNNKSGDRIQFQFVNEICFVLLNLVFENLWWMQQDVLTSVTKPYAVAELSNGMRSVSSFRIFSFIHTQTKWTVPNSSVSEMSDLKALWTFQTLCSPYDIERNTLFYSASQSTEAIISLARTNPKKKKERKLFTKWNCARLLNRFFFCFRRYCHWLCVMIDQYNLKILHFFPNQI